MTHIHRHTIRNLGDMRDLLAEVWDLKNETPVVTADDRVVVLEIIEGLTIIVTDAPDQP